MAIQLRHLVREHKITLTVLRKYENAGLLEPRRDSERSWRSYSVDDVKRVSFIASATAMGFTFPEIQQWIKTEIVPPDRIRKMMRQSKAKAQLHNSRFLKLRSYINSR